MDIEFYRHYADALESARPPAWRYDESKPCGVNYNSFFLAGLYDARHEMFRDYRKETEQIVTKLGLGPSAAVIDMGCGTGAFAIHAAEHYRKIHAVDVSGAMLRRARRKARRAGLTNIEFHRGGFLTYEHQGKPVDAAVCVAVLHHLPDFWKLVGLHRLASMLKPNGRLFLFDVVYSFDVAQYESCIKRFLNIMSMRMGLDGVAVSEIHLREEYSTFGWIMAGLLERAGFKIDDVTRTDDFHAGYLCTRRTERES
ncbi:MAG: hypothetical protein A2Y77_10610 [Planctomycetes bacterium RBG_13_62_9]|nr:MAG: hypothetical protein A2Y77_10610 [Planctomycetes bacterium RBG_13_62_9]